MSSVKQKSCWQAGATLARRNNQEEAILWHPNSKSYKASPCHTTVGNQEGSDAAGCQLLTCLGDADQQSYYPNTNTRTGHWRVTPELLRLKLHCTWTWDFFSLLFFFFLFLFKCLFSSQLISTPFLPVNFFGSLYFFFFFFSFDFFFLLLFLSRSHYFYYCKLANAKLHTVQGQ
jgi:hypothetical protein